MKIKVSTSREINLVDTLNFIKRTFEWDNEETYKTLEAKYHMLIQKELIDRLEIVDSSNKTMASCLIIFKKILTCNHQISFLSQVCVSKEYRNRGLAKKLIQSANEIELARFSKGSIVIARKSIGDFYSKYGYYSFSPFTHTDFKGLPKSYKITNLDFFSNPENFVEIFSQLYDEKSIEIAGTLFRDELDWKMLIMDRNKLQIDIFVINLGNIVTGYLIKHQDKIIELIVRKLITNEDLIISKELEDVNTVQLPSGSNYYRLTSGINIKKQRLTPNAGHLFKNLSKDRTTCQWCPATYQDSNYHVPENQFELHFLDQW